MDNESKNVHISSPKGPEDASNIADEYPSPERERPATLDDHDAPTEQLVEGEHQHQHEHEHHVEQTDMQTELANQVAAQAIEAAVAAEVRANASTHPDPSDVHIPTIVAEAETQRAGSHASSQPEQDHMQSNHLKTSHNPRQPNFNIQKSRSSLSYIPNTSSSSSTSLRNQRHQRAIPQLTPNEQIAVLREAYAKNPNPGKKELESLAEKTGRPWNKIREYFRQRRNKLRGLDDLEGMEEPGRASGWLQVAYRPAPSSASISQLSLYNSYKHRFDPYSITTPLLGGQELIQLACATFPGCEMARDEGEYVLKGVKEKEMENENQGEQEEWEKGMEGLVEPLRAGSWLLSSFQHQNDPNAPSTLTQTDLYTSYAARFSSLLTSAGQNEASDEAPSQQAEQPVNEEEQDHEADMRAFEDAGLNSTNDQEQDQENQQNEEQPMNVDEHQSLASLSLLPEPVAEHETSSLSSPPPTASITPSIKKENRLLNPLELINLARMTFPKCEPTIDGAGRFVIKGLERRNGIEPGSKEREREMFPFALHNELKPGQAFVGLMKRKLGMLAPEPTETKNTSSLDEVDGNERDPKKAKLNGSSDGKAVLEELSEEDKELISGLKRFRESKLGEEVRDACVSQ
ncbi:uncharacterized protein IL334_002023 [Kwoniella shivajii]|uniref:Homeobox domain-containing protein n=1 Tax=Kwoniella shivajii TaxID=564305 RepID=A0ABZ1CTK7_9TREE|nr:hypothetical protein IL334_002023 [Kwoniella shivajii]